MFEGLAERLFDPSGLSPHGFCLLWDPGLIWTYAISDIGIGLAYFTIPLALAIVARRRRDLVFRPVFWLFAAFILACGTTHFLDVATLWVPLYWVEATVKVVTAVTSIVTAVALWRILPDVLALPSHAQLAAANAALHESEARLHQSQKMEAVGQLTGGIAHDINNMLQGIGGSLDMIERRIAQGRSDGIVRYCAVARQAVDSASGLTHRMLAFARRQTLVPSRVEPDALVRGMEDLIRRSVPPMIDVSLSLHDGIWAALCDPNQLESALLNLAINARDAMPDGGALTIATADRTMTAADLTDQDEARPGDYVEITVSDTGSGMAPDVLNRVFEPFFTTKPVGQGTGLGLSQVYGFVRQSGGFVRLDSEPGRGTTVRLYLPRHRGTGGDQETAMAAVPAAQAAAAFAGTVLLVDDEDGVRFMVAEALRDQGCLVIEASDGPSALGIVQSARHIDLLVTDVGLPGLNGRQLADAALQIRPDMPVLMITGYAGKALDDIALPQGMEVLRKPFPIDVLTARARALMPGAIVG
jgi:signal transduction histidine kinase